MAIAHKVPCTLNRSTLLDVLQDLRIARFESDDQQPATGFPHGFQRVVVGGYARGAAPSQTKRLKLFAQFNRARLLDVERIVVEEELLHFGEVRLCPLQL